MYLVTGASSGLGKYLANELSAVTYARHADLGQYQGQHFDAVIHCAYNASRDSQSSAFCQYVYDNFLMTQRLLALNFDKFIFISSSDVYPSNVDKRWLEDDNYLIDHTEGLYSTSKLITESLIKSKRKNHLIIRPTALLGHCARPNSLIKLLTIPNVTLTLSKESRFNYILYEDILTFIKNAMKQDQVGVFNAASNDSLTLEDVINQFNIKANFGGHTYRGRLIANDKIKNICPDFDKKSIEVVNQFYLTLKGSKIC